MKHEPFRLCLEEGQHKELTDLYHKIVAHVEKGNPLHTADIETLKQTLSRVVAESKPWRSLLEKVRDGKEHLCLHLLHTDNTILNLPWHLAANPVSGGPLLHTPQLTIAKGQVDCYTPSPADASADAPAPGAAPAPLKILIMIAAPETPHARHQSENRPHNQRLSYEEEEAHILEAFEPLLAGGIVQIDFTDDGSLEALERKLQANRYHILHFSGHASFNQKKQQGSLYLEHPVTLEPAPASDIQFAEAVNRRSTYHVPPLVVLASCQTAAGGSEKGLRGITNRLLQKGAQAVVAMGMSIEDRYATLFAARFYDGMARKKKLFAAYTEALVFLEQTERADLLKARAVKAVPLQWLIPNLYLSGNLDGIVDWSGAREKLTFATRRWLMDKNRLLLEHEKNYLFIGRRKDKAGILPHLLARTPVLLKGQGGVGKTAMAEHLVQRLVAKNPDTVPFVFDEKNKSFDHILDTLQKFCRKRKLIDTMKDVAKFDKAMDKLAVLLAGIETVCLPVFVLDNLESFQDGAGGGFLPRHADWLETLQYLCEDREYHVVLTCRYPVSGVPHLKEFDLHQVGLNDFRKKCVYLDVGRIRSVLTESAAKDGDPALVENSRRVTYRQVVDRLYGTFGGNYRALEFFSRLLAESPGIVPEALASLEEFQKSTETVSAEVRERMGKNLLFGRLLALVEPPALEVLYALAPFRVPVIELALNLQLGPKEKNYGELLASLQRLTLVEITPDREFEREYYYVTPLVEDLLPKREDAVFSHEKAGRYYYHMIHNDNGDLSMWEEAFYHFDQSGTNREKLHEIGERLASVFYDLSLFQTAFYYARRVYDVMGDETGNQVLNTLGLIYNLFGQYEPALEVYLKALAGVRKEGNKEGEGTTLNNISQIYHARGDYDSALKYLEQSLRIQKEIGDKSGEGTTLNNISQIYDARGDY
ncbi:MAG: CHAT domain-containing protein, partial [bacterium]|nr:CHAT domain-containing protein [bacterium]